MTVRTRGTTSAWRLLLACGVCAALLSGLACNDNEKSTGEQAPRLTAGEAEDIAGVKAALRRMATGGDFSGAVLIAKNGKVLFSRAYGLADRERRIPNTLDTRFRIGSMNKMFTAVAVLQLVEAGEIELSAPLGKYLIDYPNKDVAGKVTIHQLLTHTGGTGDIFGPEFDAHRRELRTHSDYIELYGERGLEFRPGSRWAYSNYGFILLGAVIEKVTGHSVPDRSIGYTRPPGTTKRVRNTKTLPYRGTSAGGGYSTVTDLRRFADALMSHKLLRADSTEQLITGKVETPSREKYAYGFDDRRDMDGHGSVGHGGGAPGINGDLRFHPKSGYVLAALANIDPPAAQTATAWVCAYVVSPPC